MMPALQLNYMEKHRSVNRTADALGAWDVLEMGTLGGARILGRDDIGRLEPGMAADIALYDLRRLPFAGAAGDPAAALVFCGGSERVRHSIVNGRVLVREGRIDGLDEAELTERHNRWAETLRERASARTGIDYSIRRP